MNKPVFDKAAFARAISDELAAKDWSFGDACRIRPHLNKAMLSRAVNQQPVSVTNFLILCRAFSLVPQFFLSAATAQKKQQEQTVTAFAQRETIQPAGPAP